MTVETIERCDVCDREVPLRGVKGQRIYRGQFRSWWHWWSRDEEPKGPITLCCECWDSLVRAVRRTA